MDKIGESIKLPPPLPPPPPPLIILENEGLLRLPTVPSTLLLETLLLKTQFQSAGGGDGVVSRSDPDDVDRPRIRDVELVGVRVESLIVKNSKMSRLKEMQM